MEYKCHTKVILRAWLYQLLAELEMAEEVEATKTELVGKHTVLQIQFKS